MDVSVIIPLYNMEKFVEEGIGNVAAQTGVELECIVVDDGSTDRGAEAVERAIRGRERFRLIRTENRGSGPARNTGIAEARGEYLYFFDIDDYMEPTLLQTLVKAAREAEADLTVCGFTRESLSGSGNTVIALKACVVDGDTARKHYDQYMEGEHCVQGAPWNKLFRRDVALQYALEYPALRRNQDEVFIMRYVAKARKIALIEDVLYHHRINDIQALWSKYKPDYGENVEQLFRFYDDIIVAWNPENQGVLRRAGWLYYGCVLNALYGIFNPKWRFSERERYHRVKREAEQYRATSARYRTKELDAKLAATRYAPLMLGGKYLRLYAILRLKTAYMQMRDARNASR